MNRSDDNRLRDIREAAEAIGRHLALAESHEDVVFDAVRVRLIEIGEAAKDISADRLAREPAIAWKEIAAMRDRLAHRYFDTEHAIVFRTARHDVPELLAAVDRLLGR